MNTNKINGLNEEEVIKNRKAFGDNKLTNKKKVTIFSLILESLNDPIVKILLIALAVKVLLIFNKNDLFETLGIAIAVFLASFISVISEYGSEKAFERLNEENNMIDVKVIRNNKRKIISIDDVVVGDIVLIESGDKIPADGIIIDGELYVDESSLTGESKEKYKAYNDVVYRGSVVTSKHAIIKINNVGDKTFYGKVASEIQEEKIESPLKLRLRNLAKIISIFGYISAILVFVSYLLNAVIIPNDYSNILSHILYALTLSVAVVVMAVPEGLPMMITLVLSSNMKRLLKRNVLVRKLVGIETSGSLNILFTDKTGTLTEGKLKVIEFLDASLNKVNYLNDIYYQSLVYNNDSFYINNEVTGSNTTDRAILEYCKTDSKDKYKILKKEEFSSEIKYSSVTTNYNNKTTFYKGAYELIVDKCSMYLNSNMEEKVLLEKEKILEFIKSRTSNGQRVIALAYSNSNKFDKLVLTGFIFLKDNIRKEAYDAINDIKSSGINVVMITGDAKDTACSIAKELKIINNKNDIVITSEEFNKMSDNEVLSKLNNIKVLCRSLPQDKNRLVKLAQMKGLIVGMTGDGINDAPALRHADVGFAMGSGSEVAKETSDIIILDNNISSISWAILYGRTIFKNIRKFVTFQLSVNLCAVLLSIIGPFIGVLSPITVIQVLWVNMVMDTFSGLAFSFEPALKEYMKEPPKPKDEKIINSYMLNQIIVDGIYGTFLCIFFLKSTFTKAIYSFDVTDKYLLTAFFGLFIFLDIFLAFNSRTHRLNILSNLLKNKIFLIMFTFITIVQIILIYYGGELFRTTGLTLIEFEIMILFAFSIVIVDIIRKIVLKKKNIERSF
ncbi:MAG: calcium-translocating P-type ATPase, PMCA-type [Bacilli bacterium]